MKSGRMSRRCDDDGSGSTAIGSTLSRSDERGGRYILHALSPLIYACPNVGIWIRQEEKLPDPACLVQILHRGGLLCKIGEKWSLDLEEQKKL